MDSSQSNLDSEILQTGQCLLELLRKSLCPRYVRDGDHIMLTSPWEDGDFRVGIYLYDIQDYSPIAVQETVIDDRRRRFAPKAVELSYMVFCNDKHRFGGVNRERMQGVLNEVARAVYDHPTLRRADGEEFQTFFLREDVEFKIHLWGSFNQPLQPALYIQAVPVLIMSNRIREATGVKEREFGVDKV